MRYTFIRANSTVWPVRWLCRLLEVHPSGYYAWQKHPRSAGTIVNQRLTGLIKQFWLQSGGVYGYRKIHCDLRDIGEQCGENRVYRLMRAAGLRAQVGYRRPGHRSGPARVLAPNRLQRKFEVANPNDTWVTDITHIHTSRLAIPGSSDRSLLTQGGWLVDAFPDQERVSAECIADGGLAQKTWFFGYRAF